MENKVSATFTRFNNSFLRLREEGEKEHVELMTGENGEWTRERTALVSLSPIRLLIFSPVRRLGLPK